MLDELPIVGAVALLACVGVLATGMAIFKDFPWEALATLVTGMLAVGGAIYIGKKQMVISNGQNGILREQADITRDQAAIASRQTDILDKQTDIQNRGLRIELFDMRFAVFETTEKWLSFVMNGQELTGQTVSKDFKRARDQSKFLFNRETNVRLKEVSDKGYAYFAKRNVNNHNVAIGRDVTQRQIEDVQNLEYWLWDRLYNLSDLFGPELAVSDDPFVAELGEGKIDWRE